jgi:hypothetical protein
MRPMRIWGDNALELRPVLVFDDPSESINGARITARGKG